MGQTSRPSSSLPIEAKRLSSHTLNELVGESARPSVHHTVPGLVVSGDAGK